MSFIEMLDVVNQQLTLKGEEPVAFEYDREGIRGSCSLVSTVCRMVRIAAPSANSTCVDFPTAPRSP